MLVATRSFVVEGDPTGQFTAGRTRVAPDHWAVKRWPDRFRPDGSQPGRVSRAESGAASIVAAVPTPYLYHPVPAPRIEIDDGAWSRLVGELQDSKADLETGGFLYADGYRRDLHVAVATECVAMRGTHSLELDPGRRQDFEDHLEQRDSGLVRAGHWHSHPGRDSSGEPSETDLQAWQAGFELLESRSDRPRDFIGLILTPSRSFGWSVPQVHGFRVTRDRGTRYVHVEAAKTNWDAA